MRWIYNPGMVRNYNGQYSYNRDTITNWNSDSIGVYYCGYILPNGNLSPFYIGRAVGQGGIRARLLEHLLDDSWPDVTHFGYCICDTVSEAENLESQEILNFNPKYNTQGTWQTYLK